MLNVVWSKISRNFQFSHLQFINLFWNIDFVPFEVFPPDYYALMSAYFPIFKYFSKANLGMAFNYSAIPSLWHQWCQIDVLSIFFFVFLFFFHFRKYKVDAGCHFWWIWRLRAQNCSVLFDNNYLATVNSFG